MLKESPPFGMVSKFAKALKHPSKITTISGKVQGMLPQVVLGKLPSFPWTLKFIMLLFGIDLTA